MLEALNKNKFDYYYSVIYFLTIANSCNSYIKMNINVLMIVIVTWQFTDQVLLMSLF